MGFEFMPKFQKVVDLTIENHPDGFFTIRHGLVTAREIDDGEPAKAEAERSRDVVALVIRTSMDEGVRHPFDVLTEDGSLAPKTVLPANATHGCSLVLPRVHYRGATWKSSSRFILSMDFRMALSFSICSLRWNLMSSSDTGLSMRRKAAQV